MARCSRQSRILAEAPFARIGAVRVDPITVKMDGNSPPSGPLLRFIPVILVWSIDGTHAENVATVSNILAVAGRAHLVGLHL